MVLFIINGHTKRLFVNVPMRSQDDIDAEIERRRQQFLADREAERVRAENALVRREETQAEFDKLVSAIEWYVEKTESTEAKRKWQNMNSRHSQHHGAITLPDLLELCHLLGIDLATLVILSPITATASH